MPLPIIEHYTQLLEDFTTTAYRVASLHMEYILLLSCIYGALFFVVFVWFYSKGPKNNLGICEVTQAAAFASQHKKYILFILMIFFIINITASLTFYNSDYLLVLFLNIFILLCCLAFKKELSKKGLFAFYALFLFFHLPVYHFYYQLPTLQSSKLAIQKLEAFEQDHLADFVLAAGKEMQQFPNTKLASTESGIQRINLTLNDSTSYNQWVWVIDTDMFPHQTLIKWDASFLPTPNYPSLFVDRTPLGQYGTEYALVDLDYIYIVNKQPNNNKEINAQPHADN